MTEDWRHGGFGLYVHWPFCESKCPYCDFNSHVRDKVDQKQWRNAYLKEIDRLGALLPNRLLNSVFFGGGTPSLMDPDVVSAILDRVRDTWPLANDFEVSLEANPTSVEANRFAGYAAAGVNRISLGVQALNDDDLKRLGRTHSVEDGEKAFEIARARFDRVSFDLIYARQDQTLKAWEAELKEALSLAVDHLSLYQLTIEPGTAFGDRQARGGLRGLPGEDLAADMFELTQELCSSAGFDAYEVSNHAKPGAESRHNLIYWRYGDYIGIGPGAHGRLSLGTERYAVENWANPEKWLRKVEIGSPEKSKLAISSEDQASELLMMGLRLSAGVELDRLHELATVGYSKPALEQFVDLELLTVEDRKTLRVTPKGRLVLNAIIRELVPS